MTSIFFSPPPRIRCTFIMLAVLFSMPGEARKTCKPVRHDRLSVAVTGIPLLAFWMQGG